MPGLGPLKLAQALVLEYVCGADATLALEQIALVDEGDPLALAGRRLQSCDEHS